MTGQNYLEIPPQRQSVNFTGGCSGLCTAALPGPINIAASVLHMHLLGQSGDILIIRKGGSVEVLVNQTTYDYNSPKPLSYEPSIQFQPGDQFRVDCNYNSMSRTNTTYWGLSTTDEMCYGFVTYYPANDNFIVCQQWRTVNGYCIAGFVDCDLTTFQVMSSTLRYICKGLTCPVSCRRSLETIAETGCMSGDIVKLFQFDDPVGMSQLFPLFPWCGVPLASTPLTSTPPTSAKPCISAGERPLSTYGTFLVPLTVFSLARVADLIR